MARLVWFLLPYDLISVRLLHCAICIGFHSNISQFFKHEEQEMSQASLNKGYRQFKEEKGDRPAVPKNQTLQR